MDFMRIAAILVLVLSSGFAWAGPAAAQELEAAVPTGGVEGSITRAQVDKQRAAPGASLKIHGELRITKVFENIREYAAVGSLSRDTDRVDHREGGPVEHRSGVWFLLYQDGKPIASQELPGPFAQGKVLTHTFAAQAPRKPGHACFELVAIRSFRPLDRMDSRQACLMIQEAADLVDARAPGARKPAAHAPGQKPAAPRGAPDPPPSPVAQPAPTPRVDPAGRPPPVDPGSPRHLREVLDASNMTPQLFEALPPDTRFRIGDRTLTKGELPRLADEELQKADAWHRAQNAKIQSELAAEQVKLDQQRKVDLAAAAAEIMMSLETGPSMNQIKGEIVDTESVECLVKPKITGFLPGSKVTPGGTIVMFGCGFYGSPAMRLYFPLSGGDVVVTPQLWEPGVFAGVIPSGIVARAQTGFLLVHTSHGTSNPWFVEFMPEEEIRLLSGVDIDCSGGAYTKDICHRKSSCGGSMCASHTNYAFWPDGGKDRVEAAGELGYGWTYYSTEFSKSSSNGEAAAEYNANPLRPKVRVNWNVGPFGSIAYNVKILIKGPKGIPHYMGQLKDPPPPPPGNKMNDPYP